MKRGPGDAARRIAERAAGCSLVAGLCACTLLAPVPPVRDQGYFPPATGAAATAAADHAAHEGDACRPSAGRPAAQQPACFAEGLGIAMARVEAGRRALLDNAREVVVLQTSYNALLYPFGAAAVYEKLRGAPNHNLLLPAVLGSALYGLLNSGIPERDKQYLQSAGELLCSLAWHGQWLWLEAEIHDDRASSASLDTVIARLSQALMAYESAWAGLALEAPGVIVPSGALERAKTGATAAPGNTTRAVLQRAQRQAAAADGTLQQLQRLRTELRRAAISLSHDADMINADLQRRLGERVPAPRTPQEVALALLEANRSLATGQAGEDTTPDMAPLVGPDLLSGLSRSSQKAVRDLAATQGAGLYRAWRQARLWLAEQADRRQQVRQAVAGLPCAPATLARMGQAQRTAVSSPTGASANSQAVTTRPLLP